MAKPLSDILKNYQDRIANDPGIQERATSGAAKMQELAAQFGIDTTPKTYGYAEQAEPVFGQTADTDGSKTAYRQTPVTSRTLGEGFMDAARSVDISTVQALDTAVTVGGLGSINVANMYNAYKGNDLIHTGDALTGIRDFVGIDEYKEKQQAKMSPLTQKKRAQMAQITNDPNLSEIDKGMKLSSFYLQNPDMLGLDVAQTLPQSFIEMPVIGGMVGKALPTAGLSTKVAFGAGVPIFAGSINDINADPTVELDATSQIAAFGSGVAGGTISGVMSKLAPSWDVDRLLVGGASKNTSAITGLVKYGAGEVIDEVPQEWAQTGILNLNAGRDITEGMGAATATAAFVGFGSGVGTGSPQIFAQALINGGDLVNQGAKKVGDIKNGSLEDNADTEHKKYNPVRVYKDALYNLGASDQVKREEATAIIQSVHESAYRKLSDFDEKIANATDEETKNQLIKDKAEFELTKLEPLRTEVKAHIASTAQHGKDILAAFDQQLKIIDENPEDPSAESLPHAPLPELGEGVDWSQVMASTITSQSNNNADPNKTLKPTTNGKGLKVAVVGDIRRGDTGRSTGNHLDIRYSSGWSRQNGYKQRPRLTQEHLDRFTVSNKPLSASIVSSEYGMRTGGHHSGIDFDLDPGTEVTTNYPVKKMSRQYDDQGGGWYTSVTFQDGVVVNLLHQNKDGMSQSEVDAGKGYGGGSRSSGRSSSSGSISQVIEQGKGFTKYKMDDGTVVTAKGNLNFRNNNFGNLENGAFSKKHGSLPTNGRFAVFKTEADGMKAMEALIFTGKNYSKLNLSGAINRYAPPSENNTNKYIASVLAAVGGKNVPMSQYTQQERNAILAAMVKVEGKNNVSYTNEDGSTYNMGSSSNTSNSSNSDYVEEGNETEEEKEQRLKDEAILAEDYLEYEEVNVPEKTEEEIANTPKSREEVKKEIITEQNRVIRTMISSLTNDDIDGSPLFSTAQKEVLRTMNDVKLEMANLRNIDMVKEDILDGKKSSDPDPMKSHIGLNQYYDVINQSIATGDTDTANKYLGWLERFAKNHQSKREAFVAFGDQTSTTNRITIAPNEMGDWVRIDPTEYTEEELNKARATQVRGKNALYNAVNAEADAINNAYKALSDASSQFLQGITPYVAPVNTGATVSTPAPTTPTGTPPVTPTPPTTPTPPSTPAVTTPVEAAPTTKYIGLKGGYKDVANQKEPGFYAGMATTKDNKLVGLNQTSENTIGNDGWLGHVKPVRATEPDKVHAEALDLYIEKFKEKSVGTKAIEGFIPQLQKDLAKPIYGYEGSNKFSETAFLAELAERIEGLETEEEVASLIERIKGYDPKKGLLLEVATYDETAPKDPKATYLSDDSFGFNDKNKYDLSTISDENLESNKKMIDKVLEDNPDALFPSRGLGQALRGSAPKTFQYLNQTIQDTLGVDNKQMVLDNPDTSNPENKKRSAYDSKKNSKTNVGKASAPIKETKEANEKDKKSQLNNKSYTNQYIHKDNAGNDTVINISRDSKTNAITEVKVMQNGKVNTISKIPKLLSDNRVVNNLTEKLKLDNEIEHVDLSSITEETVEATPMAEVGGLSVPEALLNKQMDVVEVMEELIDEIDSENMDANELVLLKAIINPMLNFNPDMKVTISDKKGKNTYDKKTNTITLHDGSESHLVNELARMVVFSSTALLANKLDSEAATNLRADKKDIIKLNKQISKLKADIERLSILGLDSDLSPEVRAKILSAVESNGKLLSLATTDSDIMKYLQSVDIEGKVAKGNTSLFIKIVNSVKTFFNIGSGKKISTLYDSLLFLTAKTAELQARNDKVSFKPTEQGKVWLFRDLISEEVEAELEKPYYERNQLIAIFKQTKSINKPLSSIPNFASKLKIDLMQGLSTLVKENPTKEQREQVEDFLRFRDELAIHLMDTLKTKPRSPKKDADGKVMKDSEGNTIYRDELYAYEDKVKFMVKEDGTVDENVLNAAALAAYDWTIEFGNKTANLDKDIKKLLNMEPDDPAYIPANIRDQYIHGLMLKAVQANSMGQTATTALGIRATEEGSEEAQSELDNSFGEWIIAAMQSADLIHISTMKSNDHLANITEVGGELKDKAGNDLKDNFGKSDVTFISVVDSNGRNNNRRLKEVIDASRNTKGYLGKIFGMEIGLRAPVKEKPLTTISKIRRTFATVSEEQAKLMKRMQEAPMKVSDDSFDSLMHLLKVDRGVTLKMMGAMITDEELAKEHKNNRHSKESAAEGVYRELENIVDYVDSLERVSDGTREEFYDFQYAAKNTRMHYSSNMVNMQTSKVHRALVEFANFKTDIDITELNNGNPQWLNKDGTTTHLGLLMRAIMQNAEGTKDIMKVALKGSTFINSFTEDKLSTEAALNPFYDYLRSDATVKAAVEAATKLITNPESVTNKDAEAIAALVNYWGAGTMSYRALLEYTKVNMAMEAGSKTITTTFGMGSDGVNNGTAISQTQLGVATPQFSAQVGIITNDEEYDGINSYLDTRTIPDLGDYYEGLTNLLDANKDALESAMAKAYLALTTSFFERDNSKAILIPFGYNAGLERLKGLAYGQFLEDVTKGLKALSDMDITSAEYSNAKTAMEQNMSAVTGTEVVLPDGKDLLEYWFDSKALNNMKASHKKQIGNFISKNVQEYAGDFIAERKRNVKMQNASSEAFLAVKKVLEKQARETYKEWLADSGMYKDSSDTALERLIDIEGIPQRVYKDLVGDKLDAIRPTIKTPYNHKNESNAADFTVTESILSLKNNESGRAVSYRVDNEGKLVSASNMIAKGERSEQSTGVVVNSAQVQSSDAYIAGKASAMEGKEDAVSLNIHDQANGGIRNFVDMVKMQNQATFEVLRDYNVQAESAASLTRTMDSLSELFEEGEIDLDTYQSILNSLMVNLLGEYDISTFVASLVYYEDSFKDKYGIVDDKGEIEIRAITQEEYVNDFYPEMVKQAVTALNHTNSNRADILNNIKVVSQYAGVDGQYVVTEADKELINDSYEHGDVSIHLLEMSLNRALSTLGREVVRDDQTGEIIDPNKKPTRKEVIARGWNKFPLKGVANHEVSTNGDTRFSALNARLKNGKTIEESYQLDVKGYADTEEGKKYLATRKGKIPGKNKKPLKDFTVEEGYEAYKELWRIFLKENPELSKEIKAIRYNGTILTDGFATTTTNQARALAELADEYIGVNFVYENRELTRINVSRRTDSVFLFGDNTNDRLVTKYEPSSTQAVIRNLPNAIGIDTKKDRGTSESSYFTDADFEVFKARVDEALLEAKQSNKIIVYPASGIGTGKAELKKRAPKLFAYLEDQVDKLKSNQLIAGEEVDNNDTSPVPVGIDNPLESGILEYSEIDGGINYGGEDLIFGDESKYDGETVYDELTLRDNTNVHPDSAIGIAYGLATYVNKENYTGWGIDSVLPFNVNDTLYNKLDKILTAFKGIYNKDNDQTPAVEGQEVNLVDYVNMLKSQASDAVLQETANYLVSRIAANNPDLKVMIVPTLGDRKYEGAYMFADNTIRLSQEVMQGMTYAKQLELINHEVMHAATERAIQAARVTGLDMTDPRSQEVLDSIQLLEEMRQELRELHGLEKDFTGSSLENLSEFVAYGTTNKVAMRTIAKGLTKTYPVKGRPTANRGFGAFLKAVVGMLSKAIGVKVTSEEMKRYEAFARAVDVLTKDVAITKNYNLFGDEVRYSTRQGTPAEVLKSLSAPNVSSEFNEHLDSLSDLIVAPSYIGNAVRESILDNIINNVSTKALNAGFIMSDKELHMMEVVKTITIGYLNNHSGTLTADKLRKTVADALNQLTVEHFLADPANATAAERKVAQKKLNFLVKLDNVSKDEQVERFLAMASANEEVRKILDTLTVNRKEETQDTWFGKVMSIIQDIVQWMTDNTLKTKGQNFNEDIDTMMRRLATIDISAKSTKESIWSSIYNKGTAAVSVPTNWAINNLVNAIFRVVDVSNSSNASIASIGRVLKKARQTGTMPIIDTAVDEASRFNRQDGSMRLGGFGEFLVEISRTKGMKATVEALIRMTNKAGQLRDTVKKATIREINKLFDQDISEIPKEQTDAVTQVALRSDISSLMSNGINVTSTLKLLRDPIARQAEISKRELRISNNANATDILLQTKDLALYMAKGETTSHLLKNAESIAIGKDSWYETGLENMDMQLKADIDVLASLYAVDFTGKDQQAALAELINKEPEAVKAMLQMHKDMVAQSKAEFEDNPYNYVKGYTPNLTHHLRSLKFAEAVAPSPDNNNKGKTLAQVTKELENKGWVVIDTSLKQDSADNSPERALMFHKDMLYQDYVSGALDMKDSHSKGTTVYDKGNYRDLQRIKRQKLAQRRQRAASMDYLTYDPRQSSKNSLVATYDSEGNTISYGYEMSGELRDTYLERNNNAIELLGILQSDLVFKPNIKETQRGVAKSLYQDYIDSYSKDPRLFVTLDPNSTDPNVQAMWKMAPFAFKEEAAKQFGKGNPIVVRKSVYNSVFGFRAYSMSEMFEKVTGEKNAVEKIVTALLNAVLGDKAQMRVLQGERLWQNVITQTKSFIVIRNIQVLIGNVVSNALILALNDVPITQQIKDMVEVWRNGGNYRKQANRVAEIDAAMLINKSRPKELTKLRRERNTAMRAMEQNPMHIFMEAGLMSTIVEDINIDGEKTGFKSDLELKIEEAQGYLPDQITTAFSWVMMSPGTPVHDFLAHSTQFSDLAAKYSMAKQRMNAGMSMEKAIAEAQDTFINYDVPTGKGLDYLNRMGLFMFTKFFLRFQSTLIRTMEKKAGSMIMQHVGIEYFTNLDGVLDPMAINRIGNNPFEPGIFNYDEAFGNISSINFLSGIFN